MLKFNKPKYRYIVSCGDIDNRKYVTSIKDNKLTLSDKLGMFYKTYYDAYIVFEFVRTYTTKENISNPKIIRLRIK